MNGAWSEVAATLAKISNVSAVRPEHGAQIFTYRLGDKMVRVDVKPVTFNVTLKPNSHRPDLYVTFSGWMEFHEKDADHDLRSLGFKTQVGYFTVASRNRLEHPLSLHYDYDRRLIAHPYYHGQLGSSTASVSAINNAFRTTYPPINGRPPALSHVRIPTAHMDAFSVLIQILSDHLIDENAGPDAVQAYTRAVKACSFFECDAADVPRFGKAFQKGSLRAHHWYDPTIP